MTAATSLIGPRSIVVRDGALPTTPVDGDVVILNMASNNYVGLDDIGTRIWALIESPVRISDLCATLYAEYQGDAASIEADTIDFLREMAADGMVRSVAG